LKFTQKSNADPNDKLINTALAGNSLYDEKLYKNIKMIVPKILENLQYDNPAPNVNLAKYQTIDEIASASD
jgi:hypothetical protein